MSILVKTILELTICIVIIFTVLNEDKLINLEQDCLYIIRACKKNKIGVIKFLKICKYALNLEILEKKERGLIMHGKWRVTSNYVGDSKAYAVYRLRNISEVDHSGNREFATDYIKDRQKAENIAEQLNKSVKL